MKKSTLRIGAGLVVFCLLLPTGCVVEEARNVIPFLPPPKYVVIGGRKLTRAEAAFYKKLTDYNNAVKINPRDAVAFNAMGELFQKKGYFSLAKELYYRAADIDKDLSEPQHNLGVINLRESRFHSAIDFLNKAVKLSKDDAKVRHHLGQALAGLDRTNEALKEFDEAIVLDDEYTPAYLEKAKLLYSQRRYAEATAVCRTALQKIPKEAASSLARESRGNSIVDKILPTAPIEDEPPKTYKAEAAFDLALCLKAQGQIGEALSALALAEDVEPARTDVQILKARLQDASGNPAAAIATLEALRKTNTSLAEIPKRLAKLYQKSGQTELATQTRLEASELDHADRELQEEAARHSETARDIPRTTAIYERLVRLDPEEVRYRRQLAKIYDNAGIARQAALAYQEVVNRLPDDIATRRRMGILFADIPGFQGRAVLQFKYVLDKNPRDAEVHRKIAELYMNSRNFIEAERHIQETLRFNPRDAQAHRNLAVIFKSQNRFDDALDKYKEALAIDPNQQPVRLEYAELLSERNRKEEAVVPLRAYIAAKPLDEKALRLLADALRDLGRRAEAIHEYEALQALKPRDTSAQMELASLQKALGKKDSAAGVYEAILEKHPTNVGALREAGRLYSSQDKPLRAIFCWQRVIGLKPADLEAQNRLADAYEKIGAEDAALAAYESVGKSGDADAWKKAAGLRRKRGEADKARQCLREVIKIRNQDAEARRELAALLQDSAATEDRDEAITLYKDILDLDNKDDRARLNLGNIYAQANRLAEAQSEFDTIIKEKGEHAGALVGLGVIWRKRGKFEKALDCYHRALKVDASLKIAHFNMGLIYDYYMNDQIKAQLHYERFIELGGDPAKLPEPGSEPSVKAPAPGLGVKTQGQQTSSK